MFEHLDDTDEVQPGSRQLARVLTRADAIRARRRWVLAVGSCCLLLAASAGFYFARPSGQVSLSTAAYQFNLRTGPLPVGLPVPSTALVDVQFASAQYGFALALHRNEVFLAASTDGGATWQVRNNHLPGNLGPNSGYPAYPAQMEFVGFTGYLWGVRTGTTAPLWVTHDDGATWQQAGIGPYVFDVSAIGLNVWALTGTCPLGGSGSPCTVGVAESFDGGTTWNSPSEVTGASGTLPVQPMELARINRVRAYVLTDAENATGFPSWQLRFTGDGGAAWVTRPVPCAGPFADGAELAASSTSDLWLLCGSQGTAGSQSKQLYRSSDGGQTWVLAAAATGLATPPPPSVTPNPLPLAGYVAPFTIAHRNLAVASAATAWLYPSRAGLYETENGGRSWVPVPSLSAAGFNSGGEGNITFLSATQGWICAYGIGLWHTGDGVTWTPLNSG